MTNPHYDEAKSNIQVTDGMRLDKATFYVALAQTHATLALAYEQRTANLISAQTWYVQAAQAGAQEGPGFVNEMQSRQNEIRTRLGLGDTK